MALQIWLPLNKNGDLKSIGLLNNTFSLVSSPTYNTNGKIGGCYTFDGSDDNLYSNIDKTLFNNKEITFACWFKSDQSKSGGTLIEIGADLTISYSYNNSGIKFAYWRSYSNNGTRTGDTGVDSHYYSANDWHHIVVTFDHLYNKMYIDGSLSCEWDKSNIYTTNWTALLGSTYNKIAIGRSYGSTSFIGGSINDVRIYDHCLSPKEVKEISKGLVLHYPLNNTQVLNNCFANPTFNTSAASGGWSHWGPSGYSATYSLNTDKQFIYNKTNTYSHKVSNTGSTYFICYQEPAFEGGYRSALVIAKLPDGGVINSSKILIGANARVGTTPTTTYTHLGDGFYLIKHEGFRQDGSNDLVSISVLAGVTVYISEAYLENGRQVCSDLFKTTDVVYDSSGYNNNGTIYGSCINVLDSPRYDKCTLGNANIRTSNIILNNPFTISYWVYLPATGNAGSGNEILIGPFNLYKDHDGVDKHTFSVSKSDNSTVYLTLGINMTAKWYHVAIVSNGSEVKVYKDGVVSTHSISTKNGLTTLNLLLNNNLKLSDVRIYATALSSDDIKELYNTAAFIDNHGNVECFQAYEPNTNSRELGPHPISNVTYLSDGSYKISGYIWPTTDYIPINPSGKTYYYDIEYSNLNAGNHLYIGFEKYDANKQSGSNSECSYQVSTTSVVSHARVTGTINLSTANGNTAAYTKLRILNNWDGASGTNEAIIHHISLKEASSLIGSEVLKTGQVKCDEFIESPTIASISNRGNIICNQLIEI